MNDIINLTIKISNNYKRVIDQVLRERLGVTYSKFSVLEQIDNNKHHVSQIALSLGKTEASVSRQIKLLEQQNLLSRQISSGDERYRILKLNKTGKRQLANCYKAIEQYMDQKITEPKKANNIVKDLVEINKDLKKLTS